MSNGLTDQGSEPIWYRAYQDQYIIDPRLSPLFKCNKNQNLIMKKKKLLLFILIFILFLSMTRVKADGGFFPPVYYKEDLFEPTQKAVIFYNQGEEKIILQVGYTGSMKDFAWVVPVPGYPVVDKSDPLLFEELHFLTEPEYRRAPDWPLFWGYTLSAGMLSEKAGVQLHERYQVGIYDVSILSATDPDALINWLNQNNYSISQTARGVIQHYIDKNWYFIAIRIDLAPYNENLISTLKKIDSRITTQEDAIQYLTGDLVNYVKDEKLYDELTTIRETKIEYGEETKTKIQEYPYWLYIQYQRAPTRLIDETKYTDLYEAYNGYLDDHLRNDIQKYNIENKLRQEIEIPYSHNCYQGNYWQTNVNYSYCYVWYYTKDSEEYNLLKDVNCGQYCSRISLAKGQYSADDLAYVAANAIMSGDEHIKTYFGITETKTQWYQNVQQQFDYVYGQVRSKLMVKLNQNANNLRSQLEQELSQEYSQKTGMSFSNINGIAYFFADRTLQDIKDGKKYSESYIYDFGLITSGDYQNYNRLYEGDHDEVKLRDAMEEVVENVVYFEYEQVKGQLTAGTVQPLMITFHSYEIVYPLKMSSINKGASEILLYIFTKYKTEIDGFETEYAKWIQPEDVRTESYLEYTRQYGDKPVSEVPQYYRRDVYFYLNQLLDDRYFLTKMRRSMYPSEMEDLIIAQFRDNREYRLVVYEPGYALKWAGFIIGIGILTLILTGFFIPIGWINNKFVAKENKKSIYYVTKKRCFYYALAFMILLGLGIIFSTVGGVYGDLLRPLGWFLEFLAHLLNFIGYSGFVIGLFIFIFILFLIFGVIHAIGSFIIPMFKQSRKTRKIPF